MIHRAYFYERVRADFGALEQSQVDGFNLFLDWYDYKNPPIPEKYHFDDRCLAYVLATSWHETAFTMQAITEYGGEDYLKSKDYYPWYGRGHVMLTWRANYETQDAKLGLNGALLANPDLALDPDLSMKIILFGMYDGDFTGAALGQFFTAEATNWYDARTIVNGHDRATDIAAYAEAFVNALTQT